MRVFGSYFRRRALIKTKGNSLSPFLLWRFLFFFFFFFYACGGVVRRRPFNSSLRRSTRSLYPATLPPEDSLRGRATVITALSRVHVEYKASSNLRVPGAVARLCPTSRSTLWKSGVITQNGRNNGSISFFTSYSLIIFNLRVFFLAYFWKLDSESGWIPLYSWLFENNKFNSLK